MRRSSDARVRCAAAGRAVVEDLERRAMLSATATGSSRALVVGPLSSISASSKTAPPGQTKDHKVIVGTLVGDSEPSPFTEPVAAMEARDAATVTPGGTEIQEGFEDEEEAEVDKLLPKKLGQQTYGGSEVQPSAPQTIGTNFVGINLANQFTSFGTGSIPPDTTGAIGPSHFVEIINNSVAIYNRTTGVRLSHVTLTSFFTAAGGHPLNGAFDPRVLYDRHSNRWFGTAMEFGNPQFDNNGIVLAVSRTSDPTGVWDKYFIPAGTPGAFTDYSTLGVDDNGVYFGATIFPSGGGSSAKILATPKASLIAGAPSLGSVFAFSGITDMYSTPQPAFNFDTVAGSGRAYFVSSSPTFFANVNYRSLTWSGGVPSLSASASVVGTPGYANVPVNFTPTGSTTPLDAGDDRLQMAIIRNGHLWTARTIGVDASGGSTAANRDACEWIDLNVSGATLTLNQSGRVFDSSGSPRNYIYPSLVVNGQGHMAMGFSGGRAGEFVGAYTTGRLASDSLGTTQAIQLIKAGEAAYTQNDNIGRNRWGDYSYTSLDPNDDMSIWTIQEYAASTAFLNTWGTYIADLLSVPPSLSNPGASGSQGQNGVVVALTGSNFFDPGVGFANHLNVAFTGGATNGITVTNVTYNSPTSVTVTLNIAAGASAGSRNIVLTNPDGQSSTVVGGFTVNAVASGGISGLVYEDRNGNGTFDGGELGIGALTPPVSTTVFLDTNNNGNPDGGEPSTITSGAGNYTFSGLVAGTYHLREIIPAGYIAVSPAGGAVDVAVAASVVAQNIGDFPITFGGSGGNDVYIASLQVGGTVLQIQETLGANPTSTYTIAKALLGANVLTFNTGNGDDSLTADHLNGIPFTAGGAVFNGGNNNDTYTLLGSTGADSASFNNAIAALVTHSGLEAITFDGRGGNDTVSMSGGPTVTMPASQRFASLNMTGGLAVLAADGNRFISTGSLSIANTGRLDLRDNDLILRGGGAAGVGSLVGVNYTGVTGLIQSGRGNGTWNGPFGLITTSAVGTLHTLGIATVQQAKNLLLPTDTVVYSGETVTGNDVLVKFTYGGDANLDGKINIDDYGHIDPSVGIGLKNYFNGDFNFDGTINIDDYGIIDVNIGPATAGPVL